MGAATDAVVTILHGRFWGEAGEGSRFLAKAQEEGADPRDVASDLTVSFGDEVADIMQAVLASEGLRAELEALDAKGEWDDGDLLCLKAALTAAGVLL